MDKSYFETRDDKNIEKTRMILDELPTFVTEFIVGIRMRTTPLTRLGYVSDIKTFFEYLLIKNRNFKQTDSAQEITLKQLEEITSFDIELYAEYLSSYTGNNGRKLHCGEKAIARKLASLRSFFKYLYRKDRISHNITEKIDMPKKHEKPILFLEANEVADMLDTVEDNSAPVNKRQKTYMAKTRERDLAILTLFLGTGIRISECVGLNITDVRFENYSINVTRKGGNTAILYFSDEVRDALDSYIKWLNKKKSEETPFAEKAKNTDALFLSMQGTRISVRAVELLVKKYASIVSPLKKITPHKLRSTYGTTLYRETQDIYVVADVLGHKDINTTKRHYAAISDEIRRGASRAVKLRKFDDDE